MSLQIPVAIASSLLCSSVFAVGLPIFDPPVPYSAYSNGVGCNVLEDFQTGALAVAGVTKNVGAMVVEGPGVVDPGSPQYVLQANNLGVIQFDFSAAALGGLVPTSVGFVWTQGPVGVGATVTLTVIDGTGLQTISEQFNVPENTASPDDNLYFGVHWTDGIQQLRIQFSPFTPQQIDHLQFNRPALDLIDSDFDGTPDCVDGCPNDPNKTEAGICGCGVADIDTDMDGAPDCIDPCPNDPTDMCGADMVRGDINFDGNPDLFVVDTVTRTNIVWYLDAVGMPLAAAPVVTGPPNWNVAAKGDFGSPAGGQDGHPDLVVQNTNTRQVVIWYLGGQDGSEYLGFGYLMRDGAQMMLPSGWSIQGSADFDGDGDPDLLVRNGSTGRLVIWEMEGLEYVSYHYVYTQNTAPVWRVAAVHETGQGASMIIFQNQNNGQILRWNLDGFQYYNWTYYTRQDNGQILATPTGWYVVGARRFAGDLEPSMIVQSSGGPIVRWITNELNEWTGWNWISQTNPANTRVTQD